VSAGEMRGIELFGHMRGEGVPSHKAVRGVLRPNPRKHRACCAVSTYRSRYSQI